MPQYRVIRSFSNGSKLATKGELIELNPVHAEPLEKRGFITTAFRNKSEKAVQEINNLAYIVQDKGNMFFVKREGEELGRYTKAKAIKVRDEINQSI